jgi:hypothetical protein
LFTRRGLHSKEDLDACKPYSVLLVGIDEPSVYQKTTRKNGNWVGAVSGAVQTSSEDLVESCKYRGIPMTLLFEPD